MTGGKKRAISVRPDSSVQEKPLLPFTEESGGEEAEEEKENSKEQWEEVAEKVEDITKRMAEYLDDDNGRGARPPPMVKAPTRPTRESMSATSSRIPHMHHGASTVPWQEQ